MRAFPILCPYMPTSGLDMLGERGQVDGYLDDYKFILNCRIADGGILATPGYHQDSEDAIVERKRDVMIHAIHCGRHRLL
jgi:hypothetical protein